MTHVLDLCGCRYGNDNQLLLTKQIRKQAKSFFSKPQGPASAIIRLRATEREAHSAQQATATRKTEAEIKIQSTDVVEIYLQILSALSSFERHRRNHFLPLLLSFISGHVEEFYDTFLDKELFHIALVRQVAQAVAMETAAVHDCTKDAFYVFVTCGKFGGIGATESPGFEPIFSEEVGRHLGLEPHHPEFEHFRKRECRECNIAEMAVDRLSRNIVAAAGQIDHHRMTQFLPKFELGNTERKLALYKDFVSKMEATVVEEYRKLLTEGQGQGIPEECDGHRKRIECKNGDCPTARMYISGLDEFTIELS